MPRRLRTLLVSSLLGFVLMGCSDGGDDGSAPSSAPEQTSSSSDTSAPEGTSTTTTEVTPEIVLRGDGLGVTGLGAAPEDAITAVTAAIGAPTRDSGWEPSFSEYGTCPGSRIRGVEWDHLVLLFTDEETAEGTGEHLFSWRITGSPPALGTATGLGYHATVTDAEELYPGAVEHTEAEDPFPGFLTIAAEGGPITAYLDGETITNLEAGTPCGE